MTTASPIQQPSALRRSVLIGLIGEGVTPSLTPPMHELEGARHELHYVYRTIELSASASTVDSVHQLLTSARRLGFSGLNVTHPIKQLVLPLLDELASSAQSVGAVNTVVFDNDRSIGYNTDVTGFGRALDEALPGNPLRKVVLIGAGGAGAAVAHALVARGIESLVIVDVDFSRATTLANSLETEAPHTVTAGSTDDLHHLLADVDGIVNATPLGMAAHPGAAFELELLEDHMFVADVVYRPVDTALLRGARERGCRVMSGLGMAMHQAADAFEIFTGEPADRRAMLTDLQNLVDAESAGTLARRALMRGRN